MKRKHIITGFSILILITAALVSFALIQNKAVPPTNALNENLIYVKTDKATYDLVNLNMEYQGRIKAHESVSLSAEVNGKIMQGQVDFKEGEKFKKGDLLIRIYKEDAKAQLMASKSSFLRTIAGILPDMQVDFPQSYAIWNSFFQNIKLDAKLPELPMTNSEKEKVYLASKGVISEYYNLVKQDITFSKYDIYAPFTGYFKSVNREIGSIAANGVELALIKRSDLVEIKVPVFPEDLKYLSNGLQVEIDIHTGQSTTGTIDRIASFVDESTQSVNVYIKTTHKSLLEGGYVNVRFPSNQEVRAIEIPREALVDGHYLYEVKDNILHKISIEILKPMDDSYLIDGLEEGIVYVTESMVSLKEGDKVKIYETK